MKDWRKVLISPSATLRETIQVIDSGALKIALVVDDKNRLLGTITDGDIRRGILKGFTLEECADQVMNLHPTVAHQNDDQDKILSLMKRKQLNQIPILDNAGSVIGLEVLEFMLESPKHENLVVLMAGGLGTRLQPLTNEIPKPLLKVGGKPILETILENFIQYGFSRFYISVNYKRELIEQFFGDGSRWGVEIRYLREKEKLGTAGALSLLPEKPTAPILVMNGDVLTKVNFQQLLDFHIQHKSQATMCVREYDFQVPYGVVKLDEHRIYSIEEKPIHRFFVNAGIYVLQPDVLHMISKNAHFDMPSLFEKIVSNKVETAVFPIREYWLDVGQMDDFRQAETDFGKVFE